MSSVQNGHIPHVSTTRAPRANRFLILRGICTQDPMQVWRGTVKVIYCAPSGASTLELVLVAWVCVSGQRSNQVCRYIGIGTSGIGPFSRTEKGIHSHSQIWRVDALAYQRKYTLGSEQKYYIYEISESAREL